MLLSNLNLLATAPGGVARLRELILTLAVQGKLVPQDPKDEPASELLKKIRAEKDRLIAEGKIKRDKPLAEIGEEEKPFDLPVCWAWVRFGDLALISSGVTLGRKTPIASPLLLPYLRVANVQRWHLNLVSVKDVVIDRTELGRFQLVNGDLLITEGGDWDKVGRTAIWRDELPTCLHQNHVFKVRGTSAEWNPLWAQLFLNSPVARAYFAFSAKQTTNLASINMTELKHCVFPLPPLAEQSRIVTRVEELMRLCDALEAKGQLEATQHAQLVSTLLATLTDSETPEALADNWHRIATHFDLLLDRPESVDALEQTILQLAVRGLLVPQDPQDEPANELLKKIRAEKDKLITEGKIKRDKPLPPIAEDEQPFALPPGWEWVRMGAIGAAFDYGTSQKSIDDSSAVPVLRMGNIQAGRVVMSNLKYLVDREGDLPGLLLQKDDLLFNRTNSYELVGKAGLFEGFHRDVTFASYLIRVKLMKGLVSPQYVDMYMNSRDCRVNEIEPDLTQQTGQANYNGTKLKSIRIPLPPLAEQSRIVTRIAQLRRQCADLRQRLSASQSTQAHLAEALVQAVA